MKNLVLSRIRLTMAIFIAGLVLSGITAFPLKYELELLTRWRGVDSVVNASNGLDRWLVTVRDGLTDVYAKYPWMGYGTDWLAFGHIVIALFFIPAWRDPVRNVAAIRVGIAACVLVVPLALICGEVRQIPLGWRLIDCSFGIFGVLPLLYALKLTRELEREPRAESPWQRA